MNEENALVIQPGTMPVLSIQDAVRRYNAVVEFTKTVMKSGQDYGIIPGTGTKPTLLKPGAEKLCSLFAFVPEFILLDKILDFDRGLFYFQYECRLSRNGQLVGSGVGSCNSREVKYRYRNVSESKATEEDKASAIRTEQKKGKYGSYKAYVIENREPFDLVNTLDKMAQKRALIAATLIAANASEFFTQDIEDMHAIDAEFAEVESESAPPVQRTPTPPPEGEPCPEPDPRPKADKITARRKELYKTACDLAAPFNAVEDLVVGPMKLAGYENLKDVPLVFLEDLIEDVRAKVAEVANASSTERERVNKLKADIVNLLQPIGKIPVEVADAMTVEIVGLPVAIDSMGGGQLEALKTKLEGIAK